MINGAHAVIFSRDADADRAFLRDVLGLDHVDAGGGWLIFALPPTELAFHPAETNGEQQLYLLCDDLEATVEALARKDLKTGPVSEENWGRLTRFELPSGNVIGLYEPKHPLAHA